MNEQRLYHILLRGPLSIELAAWFPELAHAEAGDGNTLLVGELPDQSALMGILFRAHNLNLTILALATGGLSIGGGNGSLN